MTQYQITPEQHRNLTICIDELNQIDAEIALAQKCEVIIPEGLIEELTHARQRVHDYLKNYGVRGSTPKETKPKKANAEREIIDHGK